MSNLSAAETNHVNAFTLVSCSKWQCGYLGRLQWRRAVRHHTLEISDGTFGNVELTILTQTLTTEDVTARVEREAFRAGLGGETDRTLM